MKIQIVSAASSWVNEYIGPMTASFEESGHSTYLLHDVQDVTQGDLVFYLSCMQLVPRNILDLNTHNLVVHASDLPNGRGWSPMTWQILEGKNDIPVTLFEAYEAVDSGPIYLQKTLHFTGSELIGEMQEELAKTTVDLCKEFVFNLEAIVAKAKEQSGEPTYYDRRTPADSELNPEKNIADQFNLLRVVDNESYPAFFRMNGHKYIVKIYKADE